MCHLGDVATYTGLSFICLTLQENLSLKVKKSRVEKCHKNNKKVHIASVIKNLDLVILFCASLICLSLKVIFMYIRHDNFQFNVMFWFR